MMSSRFVYLVLQIGAILTTHIAFAFIIANLFAGITGWNHILISVKNIIVHAQLLTQQTTSRIVQHWRQGQIVEIVKTSVFGTQSELIVATIITCANVQVLQMNACVTANFVEQLQTLGRFHNVAKAFLELQFGSFQSVCTDCVSSNWVVPFFRDEFRNNGFRLEPSFYSEFYLVTLV